MSGWFASLSLRAALAGRQIGKDMKNFRHSLDISFRHCDPAGIVFYPRYFEMMNDVVEQFFRDAVGWPFSQMHAKDRRGVPAVTAKLDFKSPGRLGDRIDWQLEVARLGRSSATLALTAHIGDCEVLCGETSLVHTDLDAMASLAWRDEVRVVLQAHCRAEEE